MQNSLFKVFGTVKLVQEVTRSSNSTGLNLESTLIKESTSKPSSPNVTKPKNQNDQPLLEQKKQEHQQNQQQQQQLYIQQPHIHQPVSSQQLSCWSATQPIPISFTTFNTPNLLSYKPRDIKTLFSNTNSRKSYTRLNSKYATRHYNRHRSISFRKQLRQQQQQQQQLDSKNKSHKLLCLWPLPIVTRYLILISLTVSTLNALNIFHISSSAPSFVIYRLDLPDMFLSSFLFHFTLQSIALFGWNVLIMGLFEESLTHIVGGTKRFSALLSSLFLILLTIRNSLGFLFSKSTGWALPSLFFSNSMHEQNEGISPFLFALLVVQSLCIDDKYILIYGQENQMTIHKVLLQLIMCLVNFTTGNKYWWSISGLLTGFIITIVLRFILAREKQNNAMQVKDAAEFITLEHYRRTPLWRLVWSTFQTSIMVVGCTWVILRTLNTYYTHEPMISSAQLNTISNDPYLFTFVFMTAPRRGDPAYLTKTLESYLANWPEHPEPDSPYHRMQAIVYTHFTHHSQYDLAQAHFSKTVKGQKYLRWVRDEGSDWNQRLHVSKALQLATHSYNSTYYALMEDDFPVCGIKEWHAIENVIYKAVNQEQEHCGVFVGTGGSGLFLKPKIAQLASELLLNYADMPPDIIIQKCLMGELPECSQCVDTLVTSKTLLMYHIGYNTSTSGDRVYKKDEFQCGWRHPFNGDPSVITL